MESKLQRQLSRKRNGRALGPGASGIGEIKGCDLIMQTKTRLCVSCEEDLLGAPGDSCEQSHEHETEPANGTS